MKNSGFTLIEVLFAMAIMTIAFTSIFLIESGSMEAIGRTKNMTLVAMLAKKAMIDAEFEIQGKTFSEIQKEKNGQFEAPYTSYGWTREIKELQFPALGGSGEKTEGDSANMGEMISKLMMNYLSKAIREVVVTVKWQKGGKEQTFILTTFWVDLNHEFSLSI